MLHVFDNDRVVVMQSVRGNRAGAMAGFSLIEVLAALVIFSIGLLGLAGLQFNALRGNQGGYENTVASLQAMDAADRLRANPVGVAAGNYDMAVGAADPGCIGTGCTPAQLAIYDFWIWNQGDGQPGTGNTAILPGGGGVICLDATPFDGITPANNECDGALTDGNRVFAIKIWWDDDRDGNGAGTTPLRRHVLSVFP